MTDPLEAGTQSVDFGRFTGGVFSEKRFASLEPRDRPIWLSNYKLPPDRSSVLDNGLNEAVDLEGNLLLLRRTIVSGNLTRVMAAVAHWERPNPNTLSEETKSYLREIGLGRMSALESAKDLTLKAVMQTDYDKLNEMMAQVLASNDYSFLLSQTGYTNYELFYGGRFVRAANMDKFPEQLRKSHAIGRNYSFSDQPSRFWFYVAR